MKFRRLLAEKTSLPLEILPAGYQTLGEILLIKLLNPEALKRKKKIARAIIKIFPSIKTVALQKGITGKYRKPSIEILAGSRKTETIHKELGCKFLLDVSKVMWSKGNHFERKRLLKLVKPQEIILDMFAGIGYFSIPIAKNTKAGKIVCLEKNPEAFELLVDNICMNGLANVTAIETDCRAYSGAKADRIIMGYFPETIKFLPHAISLSKPGAVIHLHELASDVKSLTKEIWRASKKKVKIRNAREVKEYSPSKRHYVFDLKVKRRA